MIGYNKQEAQALFNEAVQNFVDSNILLSGACIVNIMKVIAHNELIGGFIKECNKGVSYSALIDEAVRSPSGKGLKLPNSNKLIVAMVSGLLYDFESKKQMLEKFVVTYFAAPDLAASFNRFCTTVILPYRTAFNALFMLGVNKEGETDVSTKEIQRTVLHPEAVAEAEKILVALRTGLLADNSLTEKDRTDYIAIADGLSDALSRDEIRAARGLWIALKKLLTSGKTENKKIKELENLFSLYNLF